MSASRYPIPIGQHTAEIIEKKSRFIALARRVQTPDEAKQFVDEIHDEYPDARHHCWAYAAGPPGSTHPCGISDDGEPHGTAGRPMLQILQHCGVGEIMVVVVRYFGGIKLGTGGLVRAYSNAVQAVLENLPTKDAVKIRTVQLEVAFEHEQLLRHQLDLLHLPIGAVEYGNGVILSSDIPEDQFDSAMEHLKGIRPHGAIRLITG